MKSLRVDALAVSMSGFSSSGRNPAEATKVFFSPPIRIRCRSLRVCGLGEGGIGG
jgi:hypothetical protein